MNLPHSTTHFIFHFVKKQWFPFIIFFLVGIGWAVNDTFFPYFLKRIVNVLQNHEGDRIHVYKDLKETLILLVSFWGGMEILQRMSGIIGVYVFPRFRANIREEVFRYVKQHSHEYFANNFAGNIGKKLGDLPASCQIIIEIICFQFATATAGTLIVFVMMWSVQPLFAIILFIWLVFHLGLTFLFLKRSHRLHSLHSEAVSTLGGKIIDVLSNMLNVRLFARGRYESEYLQSFQEDEMRKERKAKWNIEIMRIGMGISGLFLIFGMVFGLVYSWVHHWISLGDFTQVVMQAFWLLGWLWFINYQLTTFTRELGTIHNALGLIREEYDVSDMPDAQELHVTHGEIRCENMTFSYHENRPVFSHFNLVIPAGQKVGLVGFSGSGKSTFVNLLLRFYDLKAGKILIDGQNIQQVTQDSLRNNIAMIPQDPSLFHRTLMENIRYGRLDATDEEVIRASKLAHCHEFIERLDEGYEALVGERGVKLSGGQRQRIAIARAILKNAPILILDEATSSLDSVTEKLIQESLHDLMRNRTTLVIAHRLSTLTDMDRILVFHKGQLMEEGTKDELLKTGGHFAMLWNMQTDGFLPDGNSLN